MDGMVEGNGTGAQGGAADGVKGSPSSATGAHVAVTSLVQHSIPSQAPSAQVQSVIQPNQQSVIQTPTNIQSMQLPKTNVILLSKPSSVIHTTQGTVQALQIKPEPRLGNDSLHMEMDSCSDDSFSDDESPKKRRDLLTRRPSYRKILNDLGGAEIAVIPTGTLQSEAGLHTLTMSNAGSGGAIVQYTATQDGQFFVPVAQGGPGMEDQTRKREMRLLKNREAARECRRKKKEYIKCLENRVAVLESQNKALIDELKSLKELYCKQKTE